MQQKVGANTPAAAKKRKNRMLISEEQVEETEEDEVYQGAKEVDLIIDHAAKEQA